MYFGPLSAVYRHSHYKSLRILRSIQLICSKQHKATATALLKAAQLVLLLPLFNLPESAAGDGCMPETWPVVKGARDTRGQQRCKLAKLYYTEAGCSGSACSSSIQLAENGYMKGIFPMPAFTAITRHHCIAEPSLQGCPRYVALICPTQLSWAGHSEHIMTSLFRFHIVTRTARDSESTSLTIGQQQHFAVRNGACEKCTYAVQDQPGQL